MGASQPIRRQLAKILRTRREALRLSQEAAALQCEMSPRYLRSLESAKSAVSVEALERLLAALDWTWTDLAEELTPGRLQAQAAPTSIHRMLDKIWSTATAREREVIKVVLSSLR
jgi:transcriptional regulator with XRE-family HTH domain